MIATRSCGKKRRHKLHHNRCLCKDAAAGPSVNTVRGHALHLRRSLSTGVFGWAVQTVGKRERNSENSPLFLLFISRGTSFLKRGRCSSLPAARLWTLF